MDKESRIRNHINRAGTGGDSDSDGENQIRKGDDESIDDSASDVGWNSDDEMAFGKRSKNKQDSDDFYSEESDQEEPKEGEMLLSDMLSGAMDAKPLKKAGLSHKNVHSDSDSHSSSGDDEDDDEDDDELEEIHSRLLNSIDKFAKSSDASVGKRQKFANQSVQESTYSSMLDGTHVSMNALLGALDDTRDLSTIKKRLSELEKGLAAPSYVEKVTSDRMERNQAYEGTRVDMNKWQDTVVANRHVAVLDLAQDKRQLASYKQLVHKHVPTTSLEKDIQMILVKHGTSDQAADQIESDELGSRNISPEELRERQAELAKVKALMFYEQMKRHRLNKIKSKAYRSIHKRQRNRLNEKNKAAGLGGDDDDEEAAEMTEEQREKHAFDRVKERMDMRHKNTSKWAKMALQHGHADKSLRAKYFENVQLGHELTQKIHEDVGRARRSGDSEDENEVFEEPRIGQKRKSVAASAAKEMDSALTGLMSGSSGLEVDGRYKKLFDMDFMRKAVDQQRERAREDAVHVLREIEDMQRMEGSDYESDSQPLSSSANVSDDKRRRSGEPLDASRKAQAKEEVIGMLGRGKNSLMSIGGANKKNKVTQFVGAAAVAGVDFQNEVALEGPAEDNPWLLAPAPASAPSSSGSSTKKSKAAAPLAVVKSASHAKSGGKLSVQTSGGGKQNGKTTDKGTNIASQESSVLVPPVVASAQQAKPSKLPARVPLLMQKSQADLVRMAFAGPDLEEEFNAFKGQEIDAELGIDEKKASIINTVKAGWGDWAGPGSSGKVSQKILDKRQALLSKVQSENSEKKALRKDSKMMNVLISERRVKTASKYKIADLPHPFTTWEQYERSLQMPLGEDWNAATVVKSNTQPEIKLRAGRIIEPIKLSKKKSTTGAGTKSK